MPFVGPNRYGSPVALDCGCGDLAAEVPGVTVQQFIWLAADGQEVVDTADEYILRCSHCGQHWRDGLHFQGIRKVPPPYPSRG